MIKVISKSKYCVNNTVIILCESSGEDVWHLLLTSSSGCCSFCTRSLSYGERLSPLIMFHFNRYRDNIIIMNLFGKDNYVVKI